MRVAQIANIFWMAWRVTPEFAAMSDW